MDKLIAIYKHRTEFNSKDRSAAGFYLINVISSSGPLKKDFLDKIYADFFLTRENEDEFGPFESLEDLSKFGFAICDELKLPYISLHSLEEFNGLIEDSSNLTELLEGLNCRGNILENLAVTQKKSFFERVLKL
ncbi:hypothetical protein [Halobacteriovorax sp. HLS]|uniref:hypothetical protein n=1 Tax=Halobacteriovorax sp. HLS TaxID=2234000 RepID=UPI000FD6F51D|nr:hypothetical protein [Halobacteriovorax sp. HLS]